MTKGIKVLFWFWFLDGHRHSLIKVVFYNICNEKKEKAINKCLAKQRHVTAWTWQKYCRNLWQCEHECHYIHSALFGWNICFICECILYMFTTCSSQIVYGYFHRWKWLLLCFTKDYSIYVRKYMHEKIGFSYAVVIWTHVQICFWKFIARIKWKKKNDVHVNSGTTVTDITPT